VTFRRVWLRREVLPALERAAGRDLVPVLARQAAVLRAESELLDRLAGDAWPGDGPPEALRLRALEPALARRAVRRWLGAPSPAFEEVEAVLAVARNERRAVDLAGGRRVSRREGVLRLGRHQGASTRLKLPGSVQGDGFRVESWVERDAPVQWPDGRWACVVDADVAGVDAELEGDVLRAVGTGELIWTLGYGVARRARVGPQTRRYLWITAEATTA
jgi:hypothetical protein